MLLNFLLLKTMAFEDVHLFLLTWQKVGVGQCKLSLNQSREAATSPSHEGLSLSADHFDILLHYPFNFFLGLNTIHLTMQQLLCNFCTFAHDVPFSSNIWQTTMRAHFQLAGPIPIGQVALCQVFIRLSKSTISWMTFVESFKKKKSTVTY